MSRKHYGMTFIEVLVALFILVTGILGAVAMQQTSKKGSFDAMQRSLATTLAQDIVERMRSNDANAATLDRYVGTFGTEIREVPTPRCRLAADNCTEAERAMSDLYEWSELLRGADAKSGEQNVGGLVNAVGCIEHSAQSVTITISWQSKIATTDGGTGECGKDIDDRRQVVLSAFLF